MTRYSEQLGTMQPHDRIALALADACRCAGFASGVRARGPRDQIPSRIVTVHHAGGSGCIRVAGFPRTETARREHGDLLMDVDSRKPLQAAVDALAAILEGLEPDDPSVRVLQLPAAFCGRVD